jgi:hypothetical protein
VRFSFTVALQMRSGSRFQRKDIFAYVGKTLLTLSVAVPDMSGNECKLSHDP